MTKEELLNIWYKRIKELRASYYKIDKSLTEIMTLRGKIEVLDQCIIELEKLRK